MRTRDKIILAIIITALVIVNVIVFGQADRP
jgi:hypothetical protein